MKFWEAKKHLRTDPRIIEAFEREAGLTEYQVRVLMALYIPKHLSNIELIEEIDIGAPQFGSNIRKPLVRQEYIDKKGETILITEKAEDLIKKVLAGL